MRTARGLRIELGLALELSDRVSNKEKLHLWLQRTLAMVALDYGSP